AAAPPGCIRFPQRGVQPLAVRRRSAGGCGPTAPTGPSSRTVPVVLDETGEQYVGGACCFFGGVGPPAFGFDDFPQFGDVTALHPHHPDEDGQGGGGAGEVGEDCCRVHVRACLPLGLEGRTLCVSG